jgi:predicted dehydrogenase
MFDHFSGLVVGCGSIGTRHVKNLQQLGVVDITVFDKSDERMAAVVEEHDVTTADSVAEGLAADPTFVMVCVPTSYHVSVAQKAAEQGCHLFVEKPLSHTMEGVDELTETAAEAGLVTLVGCNLRFHPALQKIRSLLAEERIGTVTAARIESGSYLPEWHPDEDYRTMYSARRDLGGGVVLDHIHEIDYARWLLGTVDTVSCFTGQHSHLEIETEDTAGMLLRFENGAIGQLHLDYVQREYSRGCQIIGDEGTIRWNWDSHEVRWYTAADETTHRHILSDDWTFDRTYVDEMRHFLECIESGGRTRCPLSEGKASLRVALAGKQSDSQNRHIEL